MTLSPLGFVPSRCALWPLWGRLLQPRCPQVPSSQASVSQQSQQKPTWVLLDCTGLGTTLKLSLSPECLSLIRLGLGPVLCA